MTEKGMIAQVLRDAIIIAATLNHKTYNEKYGMEREWDWKPEVSEKAYEYINNIYLKEKNKEKS